MENNANGNTETNQPRIAGWKISNNSYCCSKLISFHTKVVKIGGKYPLYLRICLVSHFPCFNIRQEKQWRKWIKLSTLRFYRNVQLFLECFSNPNLHISVSFFKNINSTPYLINALALQLFRIHLRTRRCWYTLFQSLWGMCFWTPQKTVQPELCML